MIGQSGDEASRNKYQQMKNIGIKISMYLNYFVFAILLNSVGIVILKS